MECCESLLDVSSKSQVNQAVDASSDFRVCFTTSRSTTTRVPLLSRAVNTDITMINKFRHASGETCARVARSLSGADPALEMGSQLADGHQDGSAAAAERHAQVKGDLRPHFQKHQALEETNKRASGAKQAPGTSASEVPPSASSSSSFARLMKKLAAIHPEATR
ncbi:UNVERIFIED_CONTAM: hypothetical protein H355_004593 [Colinus virginianus]|nr:hypothetical protein H355_004593 [Colinus virginianus]